jgi:hypothetical protein
MIRDSIPHPMARTLCVARPAGWSEESKVVTGIVNEATPSAGWHRKPERRKTARSLLSAVAAALTRAREPRYLRERFEDRLRDLLNARSVELRDGVPALRPAEGTVSLAVTMGGLTLGAIDASFDRSPAFDDWDRQTLESARHLATLVLIVDRAIRNGLFGGPRSRPDGAAPIIGSSPAIRAVRERIERVAVTDFAVLIEGGIDPQPHPDLAMGTKVASQWHDGEVAGAAEDAELKTVPQGSGHPEAGTTLSPKSR